MTRCSYADALAAGAVPVFPQKNISLWLPFDDVLRWDDFSEVVEEGEWGSARCSCAGDFAATGGGDPSAPAGGLQPRPHPGAVRYFGGRGAGGGAGAGAGKAGGRLRVRAWISERRASDANVTAAAAGEYGSGGGGELPCRCAGRLFAHVLQQRYPTAQSLKDKAERLWHVRHAFVYSQAPQYGAARWDRRQSLDAKDDALTFSLKALMRSLCAQGLAPTRQGCAGGSGGGGAAWQAVA